MPTRLPFRNLFAVLFAAAFGWWAHGSFSHTVQAADAPAARSSGGDSVAFQLGGTGTGPSLTVYSPAAHTLYVYPLAVANDHINCSYSLKLDRLGGPVERENCPIGAPFSR